MFLSTITSFLLVASRGLAIPNSASPLNTRDTSCGGYTRTGEVWSNGDDWKYWMDLPLDQYPKEMNRTQAYYRDICNVGGTQFTMSFVTLDDCQPMTKRYGDWNDNRSYIDRLYIGGDRRTINVNPDGSATWNCTQSPDDYKYYTYVYEVYYNGLHRDEFLEKVGFKFDIVAPA